MPYRLVLLGTLVLVSPALAQEKADDPKRTIAVTGQGEVKAVPDRLTLSFAVETIGAGAGAAAAENAKRSTAVAAALKPLVGTDGTVTTTRYSIEPRYETPRPGEPREPKITGYVAHNEVQVESGQVDKVGGLIDAATAAGANRIGGLTFTFSKHADLSRGALEKAGADARAQAESVARGLGVRIKGVVSAVTGMRPIPVRARFEAMEIGAGHAAPTPIEAGEGTISAILQVTYEIE